MSPTTEQVIAQEAGAWLFRLKEDRSEECRAEFSAWLKTSPQHVAEFLLATATDIELGTVDAGSKIDLEALLTQATSNVSLLPTASETGHARRAAHPARRRFARAAIPAAAALVAAFALWLAFSRVPSYSTDIGEHRSVKLDDGSVVELKTKSRIRVRYSHESRRVELLEGEAFFAVAQATGRPFEVESGATRVRAIGTQFNVYRRADGSTVSVLEGRVSILNGAPTPLMLNAGQEAAVQSSGRIVESKLPEVSRAVAWRLRHLEFHSASVAEVAAEFNRYNRLQIHVADASLAVRRMSGLFAADEPQSLLDFLANEGGVRIERRGETITLYSQ